MLKKLICLLIAVSFLCVTGIVSTGWSEDKEKKFKPSDAPIVKAPIKCPTGWKLKPGNPYACVPAKPTPIICPEGYVYYELLKCVKVATIGEPECTGCEIGCKKPPEVPK